MILGLALASVEAALNITSRHLTTNRLACSMVPVWRDVVREKGVAGLGAGLSARVPRLFLSQAIQFSLVDIFKKALQKY